MEFLNWVVGGDNVPGVQPDLRWAWVTVALSALVALGYGVIAFNWYFQSRLPGRDGQEGNASSGAPARLRNIVLLCSAGGLFFYWADMPWPLWRLYDAALLLLAFHTWSFALRMHGVGHVRERLARAAELQRAAEKYREMAEQLPHMVWTAAPDGRVDFSNRRWADFAGDGRTWLDAVHPDERQQVNEWWAAAVAARGAVTREVRLGGGPAGYRTFAVSAAPVVRGDAVRWLGACADVEEQKRLAAERESASKRKMFFLNALSHDLRAPLNNVVLNAHVLRTTARDAVELESANTIVENAVAAGNLLSRLLEFAKAEGREENAAERVSVAATLHQVVRRFQSIAEQKGLYLRLHADGDVEVLTDRQKLERIVSNLVDNAIKFTERGGVTLELVMSGRPGFCVRVRDTGPGVPEQDAPRLFEEFYQSNDLGRGRGKGFGMGLAICKSLSRQLNGDVRLASTGPNGSCFEVVINNNGRGAGGGTHAAGGAETPSDPEAAGLCLG